MNIAGEGLTWLLFAVTMFLIFLIPLIFGVVLINEAAKTKSVIKLIFGLLLCALFGLILYYEPTRMMFFFVFSLFK